jgi:hydrogenase nickel incorporation protein HypA/HybF
VHELSIAECVADIASRHARGRPVAAVELRIGHLRQVVPSALELAFELVTQGTELEGTELRIEVVPAAGRCRTCGSPSPLPDFPLTCGACGGLDLEVTAGEELSVDSLELEEELATTGGRTG